MSDSVGRTPLVFYLHSARHSIFGRRSGTIQGSGTTAMASTFRPRYGQEGVLCVSEVDWLPCQKERECLVFAR